MWKLIIPTITNAKYCSYISETNRGFVMPYSRRETGYMYIYIFILGCVWCTLFLNFVDFFLWVRFDLT